MTGPSTMSPIFGGSGVRSANPCMSVSAGSCPFSDSVELTAMSATLRIAINIGLYDRSREPRIIPARCTLRSLGEGGLVLLIKKKQAERLYIKSVQSATPSVSFTAVAPAFPLDRLTESEKLRYRKNYPLTRRRNE